MYARLRSTRIPTLRVSTKEWVPGKSERSTPRLMASHENCLACQSSPPEVRTATQDIRRLRRKKQLKVKDLFGLSITDSCYGPNLCNLRNRRIVSHFRASQTDRGLRL